MQRIMLPRQSLWGRTSTYLRESSKQERLCTKAWQKAYLHQCQTTIHQDWDIIEEIPLNDNKTQKMSNM